MREYRDALYCKQNKLPFRSRRCGLPSVRVDTFDHLLRLIADDIRNYLKQAHHFRDLSRQ